MDKRYDNQQGLKEEIVTLQEKLDGKDQAIRALSQSLIEKARDHEKLSEMVNLFKNKLISENCFHVNFGAKLITNGILQNQKTEITLGFIRDKTFEEEFFMVIESKDFNPKTGCKDRKLVAVEDIDEIEHTTGY